MLPVHFAASTSTEGFETFFAYIEGWTPWRHINTMDEWLRRCFQMMSLYLAHAQRTLYLYAGSDMLVDTSVNAEFVSLFPACGLWPAAQCSKVPVRWCHTNLKLFVTIGSTEKSIKSDRFILEKSMDIESVWLFFDGRPVANISSVATVIV